MVDEMIDPLKLAAEIRRDIKESPRVFIKSIGEADEIASTLEHLAAENQNLRKDNEALREIARHCYLAREPKTHASGQIGLS